MATSTQGWLARWAGLGQGARFAVIGVCVLALSLAIWLAFFALREHYGVLFADLAPADAAAIVEELKDRKIEYRLEQQGTTIMVPEAQVHDVRLQLMSSDLPLNGGVGFEIFDKQGLGATENSQRVSYQRALQGELSRTIGTLEYVKAARVHLVLPESSLFAKDRQEASAAVTLSLRPDATLQRQQLLGVQRLVAASVPGLDPARVVVTNHRGETLSFDGEGVGAGAADSRLEVKRRIEEYVTRKVAHLLDSAYGPGQAIVTVDAAVNFDASKKTIHDLVPVAAPSGAPKGMVVRRRQTMSGQLTESIWAAVDTAAEPGRSTNSSVEVEYEYGKRMEEVIGAPGNVTRLSIGIIVPAAMSEQGKQRIAEIVRAAAGIDTARGDVISVQTLRELESVSSAAVEPADAGTIERSAAPAPAPQSTARETPLRLEWMNLGVFAIALALFAAAIFAARAFRSSRLSTIDREQLLREIKAALEEPSSQRTPSRS